MKSLSMILSAILLATGCRTNRHTISDGPTSVSVTDEKGNQTFTNFTGRQSAANGAATDTGGTEVSKIIAGSVVAGGQPSAFLTISRSAIDQPDADLKIENNHRAASENLAGMLKAGVKGDALGAAMQAVKLTNDAITERARIKAATPRPDTSGVTATAFLVGPDAVLGATEMSKTFGHALEAEKRATFGGAVNSTDTSPTNEVTAVANLLIKRAELEFERAKLEFEIQKAKKPAPDYKPSEKPDATSTEPTTIGDFGAKVLTGPLPVDRTNVFLWKPQNDSQPDKGSILAPAWMGKAIVKINGKEADWMHTGTSSQNRDKYLINLGWTYGKNVTVVLSGAGFRVSLTIPDGSDRFEREIVKDESVDAPDVPEVVTTPSTNAVPPASSANSINGQPIQGLPGFFEDPKTGTIQIPMSVDAKLFREPKWFYDDPDFNGQPNVKAKHISPGIWSIGQPSPLSPSNGWLLDLLPDGKTQIGWRELKP